MTAVPLSRTAKVIVIALLLLAFYVLFRIGPSGLARSLALA